MAVFRRKKKSYQIICIVIYVVEMEHNREYCIKYETQVTHNAYMI